MPTVEFSTQMTDAIARSNFGRGIFGEQAAAGFNYRSTLRADNGYSWLVLFSSTIPAQPRLMTASSFANTLVYWNVYNQVSSFTAATTTTMITYYTSAIATGTANWFSWCYYQATPPSTGGSLYNRIIGTVGTIGSGADLEMVTTSIVTGNQYRVYNLRLTLPSTYTY